MTTQSFSDDEPRVTVNSAGAEIVNAARRAQRHNAATILCERGEDVAVVISLADYAEYKRMLVSHLRDIADTTEWHSMDEVVAIAKEQVASEGARPPRKDSE
jgi:hypothetical protein